MRQTKSDIFFFCKRRSDLITKHDLVITGSIQLWKCAILKLHFRIYTKIEKVKFKAEICRVEGDCLRQALEGRGARATAVVVRRLEEEEETEEGEEMRGEVVQVGAGGEERWESRQVVGEQGEAGQMVASPQTQGGKRSMMGTAKNRLHTGKTRFYNWFLRIIISGRDQGILDLLNMGWEAIKMGWGALPGAEVGVQR